MASSPGVLETAGGQRPGAGLRLSTSAVGRDGLAFAAALGFVASLYSSAVNLWPVLEPARPALSTAALAAAALVFGRLASGRALSLDGARGLCLVALSIWDLASMSWSMDPAATRADALELLKLCAIYLTFANLLYTPRRILLSAAAALFASLAPSLGAIQNWVLGENLLEGYRARWLGVYHDPNHLAMSLGALVPIALSLTSSGRSILLRVGAALAGGAAVAAVVLTHSRGGALGLALAVFLWAVTGPRRVRALALAAVLGVAVALFAPASFWERTETLADYGEDASAQGRVFAWEVTAALSRDRPLTGAGGGAFLAAWPVYAPPRARGMPLVAHNIFLSEIGELGLVGFFLMVIFVSSALSGAARALKDEVLGPLARGILSGLAGFLLCSMTSGYVLSAHLFFLAALAGSCEVALERAAAARPSRQEKAPA